MVGEVNRFKDVTEGATRWKWNFGDDQYSFEKEPEHTYTEPGTYTVTLTAYGSFGHIRDDKKIINVQPSSVVTPQPVSVAILGPETVTQGTQANFTTSTVASTYEWTITGEPKYSNQPLRVKDANLVFTTPGSKQITLRLTDPEATISKTVQVVAAAEKKTVAQPQQPRVNKPASPKKPVDDDWNVKAKDL